MKFVRYGEPGQEKPGVLDADGEIRDLSGLIPDLTGSVLVNLGALFGLDLTVLPKVEGQPRLGPPVGGTGKYLGIGLNYADHAAEAGLAVPPEPVLFMKATSAICGPDDPIIIPRGAEKIDWEVELAVIIGKPAKYVSEQEALSHVAGYAVSNDVTERGFQFDRAGQWTKGKSSDNFGQLGPWLVTPDEIADPQALRLWLTVNGKTMQDGTTATMVYGVAYLIHYLSQIMTLLPGDVISTGTPPGVAMGRTPPPYLKPGDVLELGVEGLGLQRQRVVADGW
ncbi:2-keto-4-pentenoate hydratase/2-oxohepta-3-ene-1,7-dioic acid hydratase (catechol pathway) [Salinihabitans flavidus]|uniref:2-keto-4-pentenoate hydratase/2-oxohepta-3-ene-1,7-dioic acid hydratase (Catechol pathway) n=1 Tax=Salinihabitans flavidus TaxID=569882 RepID=A0A1H8UNN5_9RHOB|nr:fumarylacetoacetate hydrolase family protein [Salinihabitans flavidus]SEP04809.1 2-keto-4-pentenoate hydratase/2-oxohepta-3-ene-1,7-dioic acid hydratase (catechol pathway) [Salinihabitans flavidus]